MKIKIPDALTADVPQTLWGKILSATPVVMTVVATALAGLASSEMTRAQYSRSLAAQEQSKAGDQWGYFQAKRLRSALQRNTLDLLQSAAPVQRLETAALEKVGVTPGTPVGQQVLAALQQGRLPQLAAGSDLDSHVKMAKEAVEGSLPDLSIAILVAQVSNKELNDSLRAAKDRVQAFDDATKPVNQTIERIESQLNVPPTGRDFIAARLRYTAARYDAEARLNQEIANLYEIQVRKDNLDAERHHKRSQKFFFGMLAAQAAVIIATFAIAARKRNLLWGLAAAAGSAAIAFAIYVYLFV